MRLYFSHIFAFVCAVVSGWKTLIALAIFLTVSLLNLLPLAKREKLDQWVGPEARRKFLVKAAVAFFFIASFMAWDDERQKFEAAADTPSEVAELRKQVANLSAHSWGSLTAAEQIAIRSRLENNKFPGYITIICQASNCEETVDSFDEVFSQLTWPHHYESAIGGVTNGFSIISAYDEGQALSDAIEVGTNSRIKVKFTKKSKYNSEVDQETQFIIGRKP